jgi:hypothetical protein
MFSFMTINNAINFHILSISYIDYRAFAGDVEESPIPGPWGYQGLIYFDAISIVPGVLFFLNNWLADGLLVRTIPDRVPRASNAGRSTSFIVVISFMRRTAGPSLSPS